MSSVELIRVAVSLRVDRARNYEERRDGLAQDWQECLARMGVVPFLVPNTLRSCRPLLEAWDVQAILLTGGNDPVAPGMPPSANGAPERDRTERELIRFARAKRLPIVGICRGAQVLNMYFGGSLAKAASREDHVATEHELELAPWVGKNRVRVNSYHEWTIRADRLPRELTPFAWADDGTVEGFHHRKEPILGMMWHPERPTPEASPLCDLALQGLRGERPWAHQAAPA